MRIVSLLPAATEIVAALSGPDELVGISHECDFPPAVRHLPKVTTTPVDTTQRGRAIDAEVRRLRDAGHPVIEVDAEALRALAPDLLITQGLCDVCAVADGDVRRLADVLRPCPTIVSLGASTVSGIWNDILLLGRVMGCERQAGQFVEALRDRLEGINALAGNTPAAPPPRVVCVEWLEPLYLAGHWVPELVDAAGGQDVGAEPGSHSVQTAWPAVEALRPDVVIVMLCGFDVSRARRELDAVEDPVAVRLLRSRPTWILDGQSYTSRPGPRVVDGAYAIWAALHGEPAAGLERWTGATSLSQG